MKRSLDFDNLGTELDDSEGSSLENILLNSQNPIEELAGKIESLEMVNFMCHSNFKLDFNKRVNFIAGRNGSGKSAIMAGLVVVLGGSASHTYRGSSVSDFIKKGESSARVTVTLINEGMNSFKQEVYGPRIIITRNLTSSGSHGYVCKSSEGHVVSKKKDEVDSIVFALNLQMKNPICVLNQDVARSFLCATDSKQRYAMFARATQLEQLKTVYVKTLELLVETKKQLAIKEKNIQEASVEMKQLVEKLEVFVSLEKRVQERTKLENEYFWALVADESKKLDLLQDNKKELVEMNEEYSRWESDFQKEVKELKKKVEECQSCLEEEEKNKNTKTEMKIKVTREVQSFDRGIEKEESQLKTITGKIERLLEDINKIKHHLKNNDYIASQNQEEKEKAEGKISFLRQKLTDKKDDLANGQRRLREAEDSRDALSKNLENVKVEIGELEENKRRLEYMLTKTKGKEQMNVFKYGQNTQELLSAIEEATRRNEFVRKPIGPCGMHVKLTGDPKWARAVESVIGGLMTTYRCDNQKDFLVLSRIMERICGKKHPTIIIGKFLPTRHNVGSRKVTFRELPTILDVLSFDNDVVFNTFVDQARIETILLFETDEQAASVLTNVQNVPKNLRMGLTLRSDQYFPAPNYRTYYGNLTRALRYFEKSPDTAKKFESELKDTVGALREKTVEMEKVREAFKEAHTLVDRSKNQLKALKQEAGKIQVELNHLIDIEDTRPVTITKVALEEELESLEEKHKEASEEAEKCKKAVEELKEKRNNAARKLNSIALEEHEIENTIKKLEERLEKNKDQQRKVSTKWKGAEQKLPEIKRKLKQVEEEISKTKNAVEAKTKAAMDICPEKIETERSPVEVQKLLEKCEKYLKAFEKMAGSREATISEYKTKVALFREMKEMAKVLKEAIETLKTMAFKKERRLNILQTYTASMVSLYFQAVLQTRGYDGQLKVDFENQVLDLEVKPKDASFARKDSKTLSGGERSYSTVSFILAIWKVVQMPFYFLDEFDVFMDKVNRKVIMDLLLEHANVQSNKQFVFITPQDISSIQPSNVISVYKLADPERKTV